MSLIQLIRSDLDRYAETYRLRGQKYSGTKIFWESLLFKSGFKAALLYRISHACYRKGWIYLAWGLMRLNQRRTGAEIEFGAKIGPGLLIAHPSGIVIGRGSVVGARATFFQGVTLGVRSWLPEDIHRFPVAGNDCFCFAHASILGGITIGDRVVIGANTVVLTDVPSGASAAGVPARIRTGGGASMIEGIGRPPSVADAAE
jgi:serine O-acetyltransferase